MTLTQTQPHKITIKSKEQIRLVLFIVSPGLLRILIAISSDCDLWMRRGFQGHVMVD